MKVIALGNKENTVDIPVIIGNGTQVNVPVQTITGLDNFLPQCDFISLHIPKQADGKAVLGEKEFGLMKKGVRIVNAARGGVVDESALIAALDSGKVAFAALDVFENEPNPRKDLLSHPKIACTPHIGAATLEAQDRIGLELAELIIQEFGVFSSVKA